MKTDTAKQEIALMQEYLTRLTAEVVTGTPGVRPAAHLPALTPITPEPATEAPEETETEVADT